MSAMHLARPSGAMADLRIESDSPTHRANPQESFAETTVDADSFYGRLRKLYADKVLKTQLDQLRKQGSYHAFNLKWNPKYELGRLHGGKSSITGGNVCLFWDSDVAKWIEAACYFLSSTEGKESVHRGEYESAIDELIGMMEKAQGSDGYLGTYFTVVDRKGRLQNLRDMHELYCCGHLLEAALAHHQYSRSSKFLNIMIRYISLLMKEFGVKSNQRHGYPGHPELELAMVRLYHRTRNPEHLAFARYLVGTRGVIEPDLGNRAYFVWEAEQRQDPFYFRTMDTITDGRYALWHAPLKEQKTILGHAVRAMYLVTAAADLGEDFLDSARRLWNDTVSNKMYPTGGIGSDDRTEGFSERPHFLPDTEIEGGYAETCASIGLCMLSERLLSHNLDGRVRDVLERSLLNTSLGGGSLDGNRFFYANPLASSLGGDTKRSEWFDCCCCPPNLCRTMGLLGGYTWSTQITATTIDLNIYLYLSATRRIQLPDSGSSEAIVRATSEMPWNGKTVLDFSAPAHWRWVVHLPVPGYAKKFRMNGIVLAGEPTNGFHTVHLPATSKMIIEFDMPVMLESPHPATQKDTLTVLRGPLVYTAESWDNAALLQHARGFHNIGLPETSTFDAVPISIGGHEMISLVTHDARMLASREGADDIGSTKIVTGQPGARARTWMSARQPLRLIPFFARCNRKNSQQLRTSFARVADGDV